MRSQTDFLPIISSILSIGAIIFCSACLPRVISNINPGYDYLGIIIGILALFITFLVAWQIWQVIDTKNTISDFKKEIDRLKTDLREESLKNRCLTRAYHAITTGVHIKHDKIDTKLCASGYIQTLNALHGFLLSKLDIDSSEVKYCMSNLNQYINFLSGCKISDVISSFKEETNNIKEIEDDIINFVKTNIQKENTIIEELTTLKNKREEILKSQADKFQL